MTQASLKCRPLYEGMPTVPTKPMEDLKLFHWPQRNGLAVEPENAPQGRREEIETQFLLAYAHINRVAGALTGGQTDGVQHERLILELEVWLRHRDALEAYYHAEGVVAEPVYQSGLVVNVVFRFGSLFRTPHPDRISPVFEARVSL